VIPVDSAVGVRQLDKALVASVGLLALYGLAALYSAGQTDVPTSSRRSGSAAHLVGPLSDRRRAHLRTSPRMLEWATPSLCDRVLLLLLTYHRTGRGNGGEQPSRGFPSAGVSVNRRSSRGGDDPDAPPLARDAAQPPSMLRDLIIPGIIAGVPCLLVLKQPDLGSAIVFMAILFLVLFLGRNQTVAVGARRSTSDWLVLAFSTVLGRLDRRMARAAALVATLPLGGLAIMGLNVLGGGAALRSGSLALSAKPPARFLNPDVDPRGRGGPVINRRSPSLGRTAGKGSRTGTQKRLAFSPGSTPISSFPWSARS